MTPCSHSHSTRSGVLWPARLSHTSNSRSGGRSCGKVKGRVSPACHTAQAACVAAGSSEAVERGASPGSRSGARAARDAAPHWCREPPGAAAPGLMRDETGSGSWSCHRGCIRAAGWPGVRAAATTRRDAARPETAPPRPRTRRTAQAPTAQAGRRACRLARSAPFYRRIRIDEGDRAMLAPARDHPGLAPRAALLPAQPSRVQGAPDCECAEPGQSIRSPTQGSLQQAQGPSRRAVLFALRGSRPFGQDAVLRISAIADPRATSVAGSHGREPVAVEAADPGGDGLGVPSSDLVGRCRVTGPISNGQERSSALDLRGGSTERAAQAGQLLALIRSERAKGIFPVARHGTPRSTRSTSPLYQSPRQVTHSYVRVQGFWAGLLTSGPCRSVWRDRNPLHGIGDGALRRRLIKLLC